MRRLSLALLVVVLMAAPAFGQGQSVPSNVTALTCTNQVFTAVTGAGVFTCSNVAAAQFGTQTANFLLSGPASGGAATPTFRAMVAADIPTTLTPQIAGLGIGAAGVANGIVFTDATLIRDAANVLAQRNGTSAQTFYVYTTFTDASNYERIEIQAPAGGNPQHIGSRAAGTGTTRGIRLRGNMSAAQGWDISATNSNITPEATNTSSFGSASLRPLQVFAGSSGIDSTGAFATTSSVLSSSATAGIGYSTGAGGAVTQLTDKGTGVTLNTVTGRITMNAAALAGNTAVSFTLTNSAIAAADHVLVLHESAGTAGSYLIVANPAAGSAVITVRNITAGSLSEAIVIKFSVLKSATS